MNYTPQKGHIVWIDFNPQLGSEQAGKRPALVLSPSIYNSKTGLCLVVPITTQIKGYPFEIPIKTKTVNGVALCDQIKSFDYRAKNFAFADNLSKNNFNEIVEFINSIIITKI